MTTPASELNFPTFETLKSALCVPIEETLKLGDRPSLMQNLFADEKEAQKCLESDTSVISDLQLKLYAEQERALLVVLQGIDSSGKSGVVQSVFARTSPLGIKVTAFKAPNSQEASHDFLWRIHNAVPSTGTIGVFDRSHYEDVIVPKARGTLTDDVIQRRYHDINQFERYLTDNGIQILKCMLNVSYEVQGERFRERLEVPRKRWKFNPSDLEDRARWSDFMSAYETCVSQCNEAHAPWYIVPADNRAFRNAIVGRLVRSYLEDMAPSYPDPGYRLEDFDI